MDTPVSVNLATQSRDQLVARLTNYEEATAMAVKDLHGLAGTEATVEMLSSLLKSSGEEHLKAIQFFELAMTAVMAFKDRVIAELASPQCPQCGGTDGQHLPSCLVGTALNLKPSQLPAAEARSDLNLVGLHLRLHALLREEGAADLPSRVRKALQDFPPLI